MNSLYILVSFSYVESECKDTVKTENEENWSVYPLKTRIFTK